MLWVDMVMIDEMGNSQGQYASFAAPSTGFDQYWPNGGSDGGGLFLVEGG